MLGTEEMTKMLSEEGFDIITDAQSASDLVVLQRLAQTNAIFSSSIVVAMLTRVQARWDIVYELLRELLRLRGERDSSTIRDRDFLRRCVAEELTAGCARS